MLGYWPDDSVTIEGTLKNLQEAIKLRDDGYVVQAVNSNPALITSCYRGETLLMFANREGCSESMREFLTRKTLDAAEASPQTSSISLSLTKS